MSLAAKLAVQANTRRVGGARGTPRNSQGDAILEARSQTLTAPQCQRFPYSGTRTVRGAGGQAMRCGPKANGCKTGCSGSEHQVACGAACANPAAAIPASVGRRNVGAAALARLTVSARTGMYSQDPNARPGQGRLLKNPCSPHGREWGRQVSEGERIAQIRGEAACTAGISGTALSESQNCASALLQGRLCHDLGGNVGAVNSGERRHARDCGALDVLPPEPGYVQTQTDKVKLCKRRLPTVKRLTPLSGSELIQMTADCERRAQQVAWENDFWCGGAVQTGSGSGSGVAASRQTTVTGSPEALVHIDGPLDAAAVTLLRNALIAAGGAGTITTIQIGTDVTSIDASVFSGETTLTSLTFKDEANSQCASIGNNAFLNCTGLESIAIPSSVTSIGQAAFQTCNTLTSLSLSVGLETIGNVAFLNCASLASIVLPSSVTTLGASVFSSCGSLTSVTLPDGLTTITTDTFLGCTSLASITIPSSVIEIGAQAFLNCTALVTCVFESSSSHPVTFSSDPFANSGVRPILNRQSGITNGSGTLSVGASDETFKTITYAQAQTQNGVQNREELVITDGTGLVVDTGETFTVASGGYVSWSTDITAIRSGFTPTPGFPQVTGIYVVGTLNLNNGGGIDVSNIVPMSALGWEAGIYSHPGSTINIDGPLTFQIIGGSSSSNEDVYCAYIRGTITVDGGSENGSITAANIRGNESDGWTFCWYQRDSSSATITGENAVVFTNITSASISSDSILFADNVDTISMSTGAAPVIVMNAPNQNISYVTDRSWITGTGIINTGVSQVYPVL